MTKPLGLDLASKRQRTRNDYTYREDYRTRWYVTPSDLQNFDEEM